jgi:hypothetical protein
LRVEVIRLTETLGETQARVGKVESELGKQDDDIAELFDRQEMTNV